MSIVTRPNRVPELQRLYQTNTHIPIYLKKGGDKFVVGAFITLTTIGLVGALYGSTKMARGVKK
ncbi:hypothetical protein BGW38_002405 [Lunasporangiospora selenospora]|uniref:Uncharacterized protein n=1 Tax=Lunasporangiospora selenospora TaxID=979761 RepID=A0A9P6FSS6_9FUNG|nr:hypothetical protein BGW38_002405 [Lunasporangiospora selenospora]